MNSEFIQQMPELYREFAEISLQSLSTYGQSDHPDVKAYMAFLSEEEGAIMDEKILHAFDRVASDITRNRASINVNHYTDYVRSWGYEPEGLATVTEAIQWTKEHCGEQLCRWVNLKLAIYGRQVDINKKHLLDSIASPSDEEQKTIQIYHWTTDYTNELCMICRNRFQTRDKILISACRHSVHKSCYKQRVSDMAKRRHGQGSTPLTYECNMCLYKVKYIAHRVNGQTK